MNKAVQFIRDIAAAGQPALLPDGDLLERFVSQRDPRAFETLMRRHGPLVLGVCRRLLSDRTDAEDAFQATFLLLLRQAHRVRKAGSLGSWLYGVAYRVALKARARRSHQQALPELPQRPVPADPADDLVREELQRVLDEELQRLPGKYRHPLVLCYLQGLTGSAAARELGWPVGTLWGRLARARELLRLRLAHRHLALPAAGLVALLSRSGAEAAVPPALLGTTAATVLAAGDVSGPVLALTKGVAQQMFLARVKMTAAVLLAAGLVVLGGSRLIHTGQAAPAPTPREEAREELPRFDGKLQVKGQKPMPQGGKVVLYSRNRHGNYPLAGYSFHLGLRNDDVQVANYVNLLFGNRVRDNAFQGEPVDTAPGAAAPGGTGAAGAAGLNAGDPGVDEFQVNCYGGSRNRIVDLGQVDYARVEVPRELRDLPGEDARIPPEQNLVPVTAGHVYVIHVLGDVAGQGPADFHVKLKVLKHRDNDAVLLEWARLPAVKREK
jgi:RNA polymerase sigma factor (sigma-70 family)